jgi:hypothetical protein
MDVVLRHLASGRFLTDSSDQEQPVRFRDHASARTFRLRFLDERDAWEAVHGVAVDAA